jgi:hypothetical protein
MDEASRSQAGKWRMTAETLVAMSAGQTPCPDCGQHALSVRDVEYGYGSDRGVQRYLMCGSCKAFHVVNLRRAGASAAN